MDLYAAVGFGRNFQNFGRDEYKFIENNLKEANIKAREATSR